MSWRYHYLAETIAEGVYFSLHEVFYTDGVPRSYTANAVTLGTEDPEDLISLGEMVLRASSDKIFWKGDRFPEEYMRDGLQQLCRSTTGSAMKEFYDPALSDEENMGRIMKGLRGHTTPNVVRRFLAKQDGEGLSL